MFTLPLPQFFSAHLDSDLRGAFRSPAFLLHLGIALMMSVLSTMSSLFATFVCYPAVFYTSSMIGRGGFLMGTPYADWSL